MDREIGNGGALGFSFHLHCNEFTTSQLKVAATTNLLLVLFMKVCAVSVWIKKPLLTILNMLVILLCIY